MANNDFDLPRPTVPVPSSSSIVANDNSKVLDYVVNSEGTVVTRTGKTIPTLDKVLSGLTLDALGYAPTPVNGGVWASGQIFNFYNEYMIYNGEVYSPLPATVLPYSVGAVPDLGFVYQIKLNSLQALSGLTEPSGLDEVYARNFKTIADLKAGIDATGQTVDMSLLVGFKVFWRGYYAESDGGSNWGIVKSGAHTDDGGSIFSLGANVYVEANIKGRRVSIRKFGASDGGQVDCSVAINSAIAKLSYTYVPRGTYLVERTLNITTDKSLGGDGKEKSTLIFNKTSGSMLSCSGNHRVTFKGIRLFNNNYTDDIKGCSSGNTSTAINAVGSTGNVFDDVYIIGFSIGINHSINSWTQKYINVAIYHCDQGIYGSGEFNNISIIQSTIHSCKTAIYAGTGRGVFIGHSWIELNETGIYKVNSGSIFIKNNYIERNTVSCITIVWGQSSADIIETSGNTFFHTSGEYNFIKYHAKSNAKVIIKDNEFSYYSAETPEPSNLFAVYGTNTTLCRFEWEGNYLSSGVKKVRDRENLILASSQSRSLYDGDIFYPASTNGDLGYLMDNGISSMRYYSATALTLNLPDMIGRDYDHKPFRFMVYGTTQLVLTGGTVLNKKTTIEEYKIYTLVFNRIVGGTTGEWIMLT